MRNPYFLLKVKLFFTTLSKKKISFKKLFNAVHCIAAYLLRLPKSAPYPFVLSIELTNECNIACRFCRNEERQIHNFNTDRPEEKILMGKMPVDKALDLIDQVKNHILIVVLYTNGEPLMHPDLGKIIKFATERRVATMIATNGLLLTERKATEILNAGIDLIKIQLSGFTQDTYCVETRFGEVEKIKSNVRNLIRIKNEGKYKAFVVIDYIIYNYNRHQLDLVRDFCNELNLMLNVRPGNPFGGLEDTEIPLKAGQLPYQCSCPMLWQIMQVNFNGDIIPCCDAAVWAGSRPFASFKPGQTRVEQVWNSEQVESMRKALSKKNGRASIPMCSKCTRKGIAFKW